MHITKHTHLTYCTNIHAANGWENVFAQLRQYAPAVRAHVSSDKPFGIGLRLSHIESEQLLEEDNLTQFKTFLSEHGLYVFTMNGFPYGNFHGTPVKEEVFAPDWQTEERLAYTKRLADILCELLPSDTEGGISTIPLSYKPWKTDTKKAWEAIVKRLCELVWYLHEKEKATGKHIHLDIEPEPFGLVETTTEFIAFMKQHMLKQGIEILAKKEVTKKEAEKLIRKHIRLCFDTCHAAVEYEDMQHSLEALKQAGLLIGKVQISSALKVHFETEDDILELKKTLETLQDPVYLHQVIVREKDKFSYYPDLDKALEQVREKQEWRIHFHTPLFVARYGMLESTQEYVKQTLQYLMKHNMCSHFEIETYTWDVLPSQLKEELTLFIIKEFEWVLGVFNDA